MRNSRLISISTLLASTNEIARNACVLPLVHSAVPYSSTFCKHAGNREAQSDVGEAELWRTFAVLEKEIEKLRNQLYAFYSTTGYP